jgi:tetratricopeptide (TPR) repeat protein
MGGLLLLLMASFIEAAPADPGARAAALERLSAREAAARDDPAASAAVAKDYLELGENRRGLALAERLLAADPGDGTALALKARALRAADDLEGALAAYRAVPRGHLQWGVAQAQVRDLEGALTRRGRRPEPVAAPAELTAPGSRPAAAQGGAVLRRLERAFGLRGRSGTLDGTIRKAGGERAASLRDLERAGIRFEIGSEGQRDAVEVREEGGRQVVSVSPAALGSAREARVAAQFGRGLEEAAVQRDYDGIGEFIRKLGGRVKAVRILIELDAGDRHPEDGVGPADRDLLRNRAVAEAASQGTMSNRFPMGERIEMMRAADQARKTGDATDVGGLLTFLSSAPRPDSPEESSYLAGLRQMP